MIVVYLPIDANSNVRDIGDELKWQGGLSAETALKA